MTRDAGERPLGALDDHPQQEQALLVYDTGNHASDPDEEAILRELYGTPDEDGVYRGVAPHDG